MYLLWDLFKTRSGVLNSLVLHLQIFIWFPHIFGRSTSLLFIYLFTYLSVYTFFGGGTVVILYFFIFTDRRTEKSSVKTSCL